MILERSKIERLIEGNFTEAELNELRIIKRTSKFGFEYCDISKIQKKKGFVELMKYLRNKKAVRFSREKRDLSAKIKQGDFETPAEQEAALRQLTKITEKENNLLNSWASKFVRGQTVLTTDTMKANLELLLSVGNIAITGVASVLICAVLKSVVNIIDSLVSGITDDPEKFEDRGEPKFDTFYTYLNQALRSPRGEVTSDVSRVLYTFFQAQDSSKKDEAVFILAYYRELDKFKPRSTSSEDIRTKASDIPNDISTMTSQVQDIRSKISRVKDHDDLIEVLHDWTGLDKNIFSDLNIFIVENYIIREGEMKDLTKNMQMNLNKLI